MKAMARTNDHLCLANRPSTENRSAAAAGAGAGGPAFMAGTAGIGPAGGPAAGALPPRDRRRPSPPCPTAACSFRVEPSAPRSSASSFRPSGCLTPSAHPNNPDACIVARSTSSPFTTFSRAIVLLPRSGRGGGENGGRPHPCPAMAMSPSRRKIFQMRSPCDFRSARDRRDRISLPGTLECDTTAHPVSHMKRTRTADDTQGGSML